MESVHLIVQKAQLLAAEEWLAAGMQSMTPKQRVALRSAGYMTPHVSTALLLQHQLQEQPLRLLQELQAQLKPQQLAGM